MQDRELIEVFSPAQIEARVTELGAQITADYAGRSLVLICVLKGAFMFFADLVRHIGLETSVDFLRVASYGDTDSSSGAVRLSKDVELPLQGRDVLLVEDIVDSGLTMDYLLREIRSRGVNSLRIAALIDKFERREKAVRVDYAGFTVSEGFLVGYGLDFAERWRHLPGICEVQRKA